MLEITYLDRRSSVNTSRLSTGLMTGNVTVSLIPAGTPVAGYRIVPLPDGRDEGRRLLRIAHGPQAVPDHEVDTVVVTRCQQVPNPRQTARQVPDVLDDDGWDGAILPAHTMEEPQKPKVWYTVSPFRSASRLTVLHPDGSEEPFTVDIRALLSTKLPKTVIYPVEDVENTDLQVTSPCTALPGEERVLVAPVDRNGKTHIIKLRKPITIPEQTIADRVLLLGASRRSFNRLRPFGLACKQVPTNPYCLIYFLQDDMPVAPPVLATPEVTLFPPLTINTPESTILDMIKLQLAMEWAAYGHVPGDFPFKHPALCTRPMAALFVNAACLRFEPYATNVVYEVLQTDGKHLFGPYSAFAFVQDTLGPENLCEQLLASFGIHEPNIPLLQWFPEPGVYATPIIAALSGSGEREAQTLIRIFWSRNARRLHRLAVSIRAIEDYTGDYSEDYTVEETEDIWV